MGYVKYPTDLLCTGTTKPISTFCKRPLARQALINDTPEKCPGCLDAEAQRDADLEEEDDERRMERAKWWWVSDEEVQRVREDEERRRMAVMEWQIVGRSKAAMQMEGTRSR